MTNAHVQLSVSRRRILEAWGSSLGEKIVLSVPLWYRKGHSGSGAGCSN